jgi:hypothetical protein
MALVNALIFALLGTLVGRKPGSGIDGYTWGCATETRLK